MTALIIGIVLVVGGVAFAAAPFLQRDGDATRPEPAAGDGDTAVAGGAPTGEGRPGRESTSALPAPLASELEELELDLAMGKLSERDYASLREAIERRAAAAAAAPPREGAAAPVAADAPTMPGELGGSDARGDLDAMAERLVREQRERVVACATCGPRPEPGARFCSHCGLAIGGCPSCGHEARAPGAKFCDHCGAALANA